MADDKFVLSLDSAELPETLEKARSGSNGNLLHNWYFVNPVNQKGLTGFAGTGYGIDCWKCSSKDSAYTLDEYGLTFTSKNLRFDQLVENAEDLIGETVTFSALIVRNTAAANITLAALVNGSADNTRGIPAGAVGCFSTTFQVEEGFEGVRIYTASGFTGAVTVAAAKLELGAHQTLAHNENGVWVLNDIPDYGVELLKCQRYYRLFSSAEKRPSDKHDFMPELRTNATSANTGTIVINGVTYYFADANL